jgi:hypothetical protein
MLLLLLILLKLDDMERELLAECAEDHVGLWSVLWQARHALPPDATPSDARELTLGLIGRLLKRGLIRAGFPAPDGRNFEPWSLTPDEVLARTDSEWVSLGRDPEIGEVVWFTTVDPDAVCGKAAQFDTGGQRDGNA